MTREQFKVNSQVKRTPDEMPWLFAERRSGWGIGIMGQSQFRKMNCTHTRTLRADRMDHPENVPETTAPRQHKGLQHSRDTLQGKVWSSPLKWKNNHEWAVMECRPFHSGVLRKILIPPPKCKIFPRRGTLYAQLNNKLLSTMQNHPVWFIPKQCGDKHVCYGHGEKDSLSHGS